MVGFEPMTLSLAGRCSNCRASKPCQLFAHFLNGSLDHNEVVSQSIKDTSRPEIFLTFPVKLAARGIPTATSSPPPFPVKSPRASE